MIERKKLASKIRIGDDGSHDAFVNGKRLKFGLRIFREFAKRILNGVAALKEALKFH